MARGRLSTRTPAVAPALDDESAALWDPALDDVAQKLLTSAVRCFAAKGYHATTTRDISVGTGLSPAAMYVHFPSKEDLLHAIIRTGHVRALAEIDDDAIRCAPTAAEGLSAMMSRYTAWHARHHTAARVAQYELGALASEHYAEIVELRHATNALFRQAVGRGVQDGSFADVRVVPVVRAMLSLSIDLVRWYRNEEGDSPDELGALYADLAVKMVLR